MDGQQGCLAIGASDKSGVDFRGKGLLRYVGTRYLQFAGNNEYFLKGGADSPENLLAFADFDQTPSNKHKFAAHVADWKSGDPLWHGSKGKGLIGALNYLSGKGMNAVYFLTMNVGGDGNDVWPWTASSERYRFDVSKLAQWEIVFSHMTKLGLKLHVIQQEEEVDQLLDGGNLGTQRKLYYRELVARFAHHPAVVWNLGEENTNSTSQQMAFSDYIRALDPYDHPIALHTFPGAQDSGYGPLLGTNTIEKVSLQSGVPAVVKDEVKKWINSSADAGVPLVVDLDENGPYQDGAVPDNESGDNHAELRREVLWATLMSGGGGVEWYFGYAHPHDDLDCEDWRSRDKLWDQTRHALTFIRTHLPFQIMSSCDQLLGANAMHCFGQSGQVYAVFATSSNPTITLPVGSYTVKWYDPVNGGALQNGTKLSVASTGAALGLGSAPFSGDAVAYVKRL